MRRLHLACAAILADVAGFGERVLPFGRLGIQGCLWNRPKLMRRFRKYWRLHDGCELGDGFLHKIFYVWL